ncbi:hypothetical protein FQN50_009646 [Emmonsiellopsis sp. PD_5]|nr:hypothetical protein FQN50_009646 [Emmonsiellopsis sp. PD_5]
MGSQVSKQIAEDVIEVCRRVGDTDRIDGILEQDPKVRNYSIQNDLVTEFVKIRDQLADLWRNLRPSLQKRIVGVQRKPKQRRQHKDPDVTTHRAYNSIESSLGPRLCPGLESHLDNWYREPAAIYRAVDPDYEQGNPLKQHFDAIYHLQRSRNVNTIRWRLLLLPLCHLKKKFQRQRIITWDAFADVITESRLLGDRPDITKEVPAWTRAAERYELLLESIAREVFPRSETSKKLPSFGGYLGCLPCDVPDSIWEIYLPKSGPVHTWCVKWLVGKGIQREASLNISSDPNVVVTAHAACEKVIEYLSSLLEPHLFIFEQTNIGPQAQTIDSSIIAQQQSSSPVRQVINTDLRSQQIQNSYMLPPTPPAPQIFAQQQQPVLPPSASQSIDTGLQPQEMNGRMISIMDSNDIQRQTTNTSLHFDQPEYPAVPYASMSLQNNFNHFQQPMQSSAWAQPIIISDPVN